MDGAVRLELEAGDAAESSDVVVLLARRASEQVDLDVRRLLGKIAGGDVLALERVQGPQQADRERPGRAEAGSGGDVGQADDLERRADIVQRERAADDRVVDLIDLLDPLERRVLEEVVVGERPVDADVDVLVDRGRDDEASAARCSRRGDRCRRRRSRSGAASV